MKLIFRFTVFVVVFVSLLACNKKAEKNIFIVTVDGMDGGLSDDVMEELFPDGYIRYENAYTVAPITLPAYTSLWTGTLPYVHGVRDNGSFVFDGKIESVAEKMKAEGVLTSAFVSSFLLNEKFGLARGFDLYSSPGLFEGKRDDLFFSPAQSVEMAVSWCEKSFPTGKPVFQWLHLQGVKSFGQEFSESSVVDALRRYFSKINGLSNNFENTVVIITNPERKFETEPENNFFSPLFEDSLKINLAVSNTGGIKVNKDILSISDVADKLLSVSTDSTALSVPSGYAYFESLRECLYFGWSPVIGIVGNEKIIKKVNTVRVINTEDNSSGGVVAKDLSSFLTKVPVKVDSSCKRFYLSRKAKRTAEEIGYNWLVSSTKRAVPPVDPAIFRDSEDKYLSLLHIDEGDDIFASIDICQLVLKDDPSNRFALLMAGKLFMKSGDYIQAQKYLRKSLSLYPYDLENNIVLANLYIKARNFDEARVLMVNACTKLPESDEVSYLAGYLSYITEKIDDAVKYLELSYQLNPEFSRTPFLLAKCFTDKEDYQKASDYLQKSLGAGVPSSIVESDPHYNIWKEKKMID